jgi:hypothetical protein
MCCLHCTFASGVQMTSIIVCSTHPVCLELYHGTLDVCTVNKVRKYHSMCKIVDSVYAAVEAQ